MPAMQAQLDAIHASGNMAPENLPCLNHVMSEANRSAFKLDMLMNPRTGKIAQVSVIYDQPFVEDDITEITDMCSTENTLCDYEQVYTFNGVSYGRSFKLGIDDYRGSAEENSARIAREVQKIINGIKIKHSELLATFIGANAGAWSGDTATISGADVTANVLQLNTTLANGTGVRIPNAVLLQQLQRAHEMSKFNRSVTFGQDDLVSFLLRALAGGQSTILGYDIRAMLDQYGTAMAYDRHVAAALTTLGGATNVSLAIGAIAPVGYASYDNEYSKINQTDSIADVIYDPATGMKIDFRLTRPCDEWTVSLKATYDYFALPSTMYQATSNWNGVNGIGLINVTCDDLTPCQEG